MIETSLCVTSYNRPKKLKEVLRSFFVTNLYDLDKIELIIVDNGSINSEVTDFIKSYTPNCKYSYILNERNDYPNCLRYSKIQAREIADGEFFIDCPDDHLFVAKVPWISQCIERIKSEQTVGCINYFAFPDYRFEKSNNKMTVDERNPNFCVSHYKGYSDFHIMSRSTYEKIGPYKHELGRGAEGEYMERSYKMGYFRNLMMKPVAICMDDGKFGEGPFGYRLLNPVDEDYYNNDFIPWFRNSPWGQNRAHLPIQNEGLVTYCRLPSGNQRIEVRNE